MGIRPRGETQVLARTRTARRLSPFFGRHDLGASLESQRLRRARSAGRPTFMETFLGFCEVLRGLLRRARDPFVRSESSGVLRTLYGVEPACL